MGIATQIEDNFQEQLNKAWDVLPALMDGLGWAFGAAIGLYFVMVLINYIVTGEASKMPVLDLLKRFIYLAIVCSFAFSAGNYEKWVKEPVLNLPKQVSALVTVGSTETASAIDRLIQQNAALMEKVKEPVKDKGVLRNFGIWVETMLASLVILIFGTFFVVITFTYLMVAKILTNVVLIIGPIFIMFAFFGQTREYFMKWVGVLLNYIFLVVVFSAVFAMMFNALESYNPTSTGLVAITMLFFTYLLFTSIIMAVPSLTSSLTGGVGLSPFGQMAGPLAAMAKAAGAAGVAGMVGGKALYNLLKNRAASSIGKG